MMINQVRLNRQILQDIHNNVIFLVTLPLAHIAIKG